MAGQTKFQVDKDSFMPIKPGIQIAKTNTGWAVFLKGEIGKRRYKTQYGARQAAKGV